MNITNYNDSDSFACISWHFYYPLADDTSGGSVKDLSMVI